MKFFLMGVFLTMAPLFASARTISIKKKVNVGLLHEELKAAGYLVENVGWDERTTTGWINLNAKEKKDPSSIVTAHVYVSREELLARKQKSIDSIWVSIKKLEAKLKAGSISSQEKDALIINLIALYELRYGGSR